MKNKIIYIVIIILAVLLSAILSNYDFKNDNENLNALPKPEVTGGERGLLGIDKNITEKNIDKYLNRSDSVYRDMRMLKDPANYANIGGDSNLSGFIKGFEVIPYPLLTEVKSLPEAVGETYKGKTLFHEDSNGNYVPNYEESMDYLNYFFPKDKNIFLICGGGGYAGMTKKLLVSLGWDSNQIYNIGGFWYYDGKNKIEVKREEKGKTYYDFYKVPYHDIDFNNLTEVK